MNRPLAIGLGAVIVLAVGAAVMISFPQTSSSPHYPEGKADHPTNATVPTPTPAAPTPATPVLPDVPTYLQTKEHVYENDKLSVTIPAGWTAVEGTTDVYVGSSTTPTVTPNPAIVEITNGPWVMHIDVAAEQASGIQGGRFAEIGMGVPSVDAVVLDEPGECGRDATVPAYDDFSRVDLMITPADASTGCATPTDGKDHWFFSYITKTNEGGYFNDYVKGQNPGLVITMGHTTKQITDKNIVNGLPEAQSPVLEAALKQMTDIASTLVIKNR